MSPVDHRILGWCGCLSANRWWGQSLITPSESKILVQDAAARLPDKLLCTWNILSTHCFQGSLSSKGVAVISFGERISVYPAVPFFDWWPYEGYYFVG